MMVRSALGALLLLALLTATQIPLASAQPSIVFERTWGGVDDDIGLAVTVDSTGNIYLAGFTNSFGAGLADVLLLKFNSSGQLVWQRTWGGGNNDFGRALALDSAGNIYLTGETHSYGACAADVLLLKFNSQGTLEWQKTWGGTSTDAGRGIALDSNGNVYIAGYTGSHSAGAADVLLLKLNSTGGLEWQRTWGGSQSEFGRGIALDPSGSIYLPGETFSFGAGLADALLLKFDSTGSLVWQRTWGDASNDFGRAAALDSNGNLYLTGQTGSYGAGFRDVLLLKFDSSGALGWQRTWGGVGWDEGLSLALDSSAGIYVVGFTRSFGAGPADVPFLKFNSSGGLVWHGIWGSSWSDYGYGVFAGGSGDAWVTGYVGGGPPYALGSGNSTTGSPAFSLGLPSTATLTPSIALHSPSGAVSTPSGNTSYAGVSDVFLVKYTSQPSLMVTPSWSPGPPGDPTPLSANQAPTATNATVTFCIEPVQGGSLVCDGQSYASGTMYEFPKDSQLTCSADPALGYRFSAWGGLASGSLNPVTFNVGNGGSITAMFIPYYPPGSSSSLPLTIVLAAVSATFAKAILSRRRRRQLGVAMGHEVAQRH